VTAHDESKIAVRDASAQPRDAQESLRHSRVLRVLGGAFGVMCLAGAIVVALREKGAMTAAMDSLRAASALEILLLLASVALGIVLTAMLFSMLVRRYANVAFHEMLALIAATSLANMLPLKPGFVARVAWHRTRHGIRAQDSLRTILEAIGLSALVAGAMLGAVVLLRATSMPVGFALLAPALFGIAGITRHFRMFAQAVLVRNAEFALAVLRYQLALALVGAETSLETSIVLACASAVATLIPFVSNGLGVREWVTAWLLPALSGGTFAAGVAAELVLRVAELAITLPAGLLASAWLVRVARVTPAKTTSASA
jgi:hypothetical protein